MLTIRATLFIAFNFLLVGCTDSQHERAEVYEAVFAHFGKVTKLPSRLYIRELVAIPDLEQLPEEDRVIYNSYEFESKDVKHTAKEFGTLSVYLVSGVEQREIFKDGCKLGWQRFYRKYPDAQSLMEISLVGFRLHHFEALVYVSGVSGCLAGSGLFIELDKKRGVWSVTNVRQLWVA